MLRSSELVSDLLKLVGLIALTSAFLAAWPFNLFASSQHPSFALSAIAMNLIVAGWIVVARKILPIPLFPLSYFTTRDGECGFYQKIGIRHFKRLVSFKIYQNIWGPSKHRFGHRIPLEELAHSMREAETAHLLSFVLISGLSVHTWIHNSPHYALWIFGFNILMNAYPVFLQRYNRRRIIAILRQRPALQNANLLTRSTRIEEIES